MKIKKILAGVLASAMTLTAGGLPGISTLSSQTEVIASAETYDALTYVAYSGHVEITGCDKSVTSVDIPAEINGMPVTRIGQNAFRECEALTKAVIPDGVTVIDDSAFKDCANLMELTIPGSVVSINDFSFYGCSSLTSVTIPYGVTSIGDRAFYKCSALDELTIPDSVINIGSSAFGFTPWVLKIVDEARNAGASFVIAGSVLLYYIGFEEPTVVIPDGIKCIASDAFPQGADAFYIEEITIPDSVVSIGSGAFMNCVNIKK